MDTLTNVLSSEFYLKPIKIQCIVVGNCIPPYNIPKIVEITCEDGDKFTIHVNEKDGSALHFIDVGVARFKQSLKLISKRKLAKFTYIVTEYQNVERIYISSITGSSSTSHSTNAITAYYIGSDLRVNITYELQGYSVVDPNTQITTLIFSKAVKLASDVESFNLTKSTHSNLSQFTQTSTDVKEVMRFLENLYIFYACNITKIYNRFDLHLAIDLVFHSALEFPFDKEYIKRGWLDAMVLGDTRCGKGYVAEKLSKYFSVGEVVSGDCCSLAGLIGGVQQYSKQWVITWGKLPQNDKKLVIIDEAGELADVWSKLSRIRSEGTAEITKIHSQVVDSRTRLICLANPPNRTIASYAYGIQSLVDVVQAPEDIARFDYALIVAHDEVSINDINKRQSLADNIFPVSIEQELIFWVWSRKSDQIKFSKKAVNLAYAYAIKLADVYSFSIPLIQGENVRLKLVRIAVAFAGRLYSNKENGKILYISSIHMQCAYYFLNLIYKKDSSGYYAFSKLSESSSRYDEHAFDRFERYINAYKNKDEVYKYLMNNARMSSIALQQALNMMPTSAGECIRELMRNNCYNQSPQGGVTYTRTANFTRWLKSHIKLE